MCVRVGCSENQKIVGAFHLHLHLHYSSGCSDERLKGSTGGEERAEQSREDNPKSEGG